jgi:oxygen-independent coproporphyrinogen III oxidase
VTPGGRDEGGWAAPAALYVHVPLCASKCAYCDFYSLPLSSLPEAFEAELVGSTLDRASRLAERFGAEAFDTVYVGGGTPTVLSAPALDRLLRGIGALAAGSRGRPPVEWTIEANPDSLDAEILDIAAARGVTRLSIGVQSLDPRELELLGRRHGRDAVLGALRLAAGRGLAISADLIAGVPRLEGAGSGSAPAGKLALAARELVDAGATHLSVYDLSVEEGTPLASMRRGLSFPGEDEAWEERQRLEEALGGAGMRRYEVSNYAARGAECLHNLAYWRMDSYIGAGPGAVSTIARRDGSSLRIEEPKSVLDYGDPRGPAAVETGVSLRDAAFETIMMAFRTSFGLDLAAFSARFGRRAEELIGESLAAWSSRLKPGEPWPSPEARRRLADGAGSPAPAGGGSSARSGGPALDGGGLDILNRFLGACLEELDRKFAA